jgi:eukaryotic-like serine/threonine-protein kinase
LVDAARPVVAVPGRFAVIRELGAGGMGKVYEAHDRELAVAVAIKVLHEGDGEAIEKLKHEFRVAADVRHDNLVRLGELFEHEHRWCFSMELVDGVDLITYVQKRPKAKPSAELPTAPRGLRPMMETDGLCPAGGIADTTERRWDGETPSDLNFDEHKLRDAFGQLAAGLAALHAAGIVHRDIKPSNIRVRSDGRVVLLDLGLAAAAIDLSDATLLAGTVPYMAPEQTQSGLVDTTADLYAMGAVLYEALVGRPPFIGPFPQLIAEKTTTDPIAPALLFGEIPPDLDQLCMALLSRKPARRPHALDVLARLRATGTEPRTSAPRAARAFVGREQELKALLRAGERARHAPAVRVITGPSGIGKTRLLSRFTQACRDYGSFVCLGRCRVREHVRLNAWEALLDGLTRMLSALPRDESAALLPDDAEAISRLFPIFARVLPVASTSSLPAAELERRALAALRVLLRRVAHKMNVVVVIDDVQWATAESLSLFARLLDPPDAPPIALVLGLRTSDTATGELADWLERISERDVDLSMMSLGPLEPAESRSLAHLLVPDRERAERIATEAGGHPLFLELLATTSHGSELRATMRRTVEDLAPSLRELLGVLAASGTPLRLDVLGTALGRDPFALVDDLRGLLQQRLVSVTGLGRTDHVEPFHAQVAEAVLVVAADAMRAHHLRLATALATIPSLDPNRRALHWAWAGQAERAAEEAIALVAAARHALAYSRAADVCEVVIALELPPAQRAAIQRAYADALTGAGHTRRAAVAYRDATANATGDDRLDLERRAAENFLRCGSVEEGMALFARVTEQLGYSAKLSPTATIAQLLVERGRLRLRGTKPRRSTVDAALVAKSDACYSLSTGLAMVDAISGALFQTRSTRFALDAGDPARAARALAIEACFVAAWGSKTKPRASRIVEAAAALAAEVNEPLVHGLAESARGICELQWGDFNAAIHYCDAALATFREHCAGVVWEERTGEVFAMWALAWRGDWGEVARRCDALARAGDATGDRYASMHAAIGVAVCGALATDRPELARARIAEAMATWPRATYDLPQVRELVGLATIDIYEGHGDAARTRLLSQWRSLQRSHMLGLEPVLGTLGDLRVRAALLAGNWDEARAWAAKLDRIPWGKGVSAITRAALAARTGDRDTAIDELASAERECAASGLDLHAAAALYRRGQLVGGDEGSAAIAKATSIARAKQIANLERTFQAIAPWSV